MQAVGRKELFTLSGIGEKWFTLLDNEMAYQIGRAFHISARLRV